MKNMKKIKYLGLLLFLLTVFVSCGDELDNELFQKFTYLVKNGWKEVEVEIEEGNLVVLPVDFGVSGTSKNNTDIILTIANDPDTLAGYNFERYKHQNDKYFSELPVNCYSFDQESYTIHKGEENVRALVTIDLDILKAINIYDEYVLPLTITSSTGEAVGEKDVSTVLALLKFSNSFSGSYSGTGSLEQVGSTYKESVSGLNLYATSDKTCYFYAGNITRTSEYDDPSKYVVDIEIDENDQLTMSSQLPSLEFVPIGAEIGRTYVYKQNDSRYYVQTTNITLEYRYRDQREGEETNVYTYKGTLSKSKEVLVKDFPDVIVQDDY